MPDEPLVIADTHKVRNIFTGMEHCDNAAGVDRIVDVIRIERRGIAVVIDLYHHARHHVMGVTGKGQ